MTALELPEAELQQAVIELAHHLGYAVAHFRPAQTSRGWRTPVAADGAGWPDLTLVRGERLIFAELKSHRGRVSSEQRAWLDRLAATPAEVHLWRPEDWPNVIMEALR